MQNIDPRASIEAKILINEAVTANGTIEGLAVNVENNISSVITFVYEVSARADGTFTPLLTWSDDNVTYVDVPDAQISYIDPTTGDYIESGQEALAVLSANGSVIISVRDNKAYIKPSVVATSVTSGAYVTCLVKYGKRISF